MREPNPMRLRCGRMTRDGDPCKVAPMRGQSVCRMHGGSSPQARASARERMQALVHPALDSLALQVRDKDFNAVRYVLDFAGFRAAVQVSSDNEMVIRIVREDQPINAAQHVNGRAHD